MKKRSDFGGLIWGVVFVVVIYLALLGWGLFKSEVPVRLDQVKNGDFLVLYGGKEVRLMGVDAVKSGEDNARLMHEYLSALLMNKNVWVEYDLRDKDEQGQYQDFVWVWVGCESTPRFLLGALLGVADNPIGCKKGVLANEQIVKMGWSDAFFPENRGRVKYIERLIEAQTR